MTLPKISMCLRYAPCLFSLARFCCEHSEFKGRDNRVARGSNA
jgi:hypothetical protein